LASPTFNPTPEQLQLAGRAAYAGHSIADIAGAFGIHRHTVRKYFAEMINQGRCRRVLDIYDAMFRAAMRGNVAAQKFYLKRPLDRRAFPPDD
jgi:AcrR family transcriptional regulator